MLPIPAKYIRDALMHFSDANSVFAAQFDRIVDSDKSSAIRTGIAALAILFRITKGSEKPGHSGTTYDKGFI
ncbi:hypothetical protein AGABI2DRAFT_118638 [Agaricus bisporus var. bisporus H97]|uniref:hypothetical protein n=1 Tax=Agaricus bisporus var. bisporus (strain H97 / ATCC MYA-4626 / FGSC 10389) TaxID=936046 RepID=UPI00029F53B7|nr:hypothetical protein AGABI2DRAFT_118638 [Agaricus bisporus var. bisporus H97]EKV46458.1 hypothetical protein AGABI2DRAFT_118638 [Agaricus bisporus var. bisporus H97]